MEWFCQKGSPGAWSGEEAYPTFGDGCTQESQLQVQSKLHFKGGKAARIERRPSCPGTPPGTKWSFREENRRWRQISSPVSADRFCAQAERLPRLWEPPTALLSYSRSRSTAIRSGLSSAGRMFPAQCCFSCTGVLANRICGLLITRCKNWNSTLSVSTGISVGLVNPSARVPAPRA